MVNETNIVLTILLSSFMMFILIMIIIIFVVVQKRKTIEREKEYAISLKNKELDLLQAIIDTQELERQKIATNIHDDIGPLISTMKLQAFEKRDFKNRRTGKRTKVC